MRGEKNVKAVPASVKQQSAGFTFSRNIGAQTLFTVHAEQATQFKEQNRSLLENVSIKIFGARGERDDSVRADECSYEPETGSIRCHGVVQIALRNAQTRDGVNASSSGAGSGNGIELQTSDILFERDSGKVSTDKPVKLDFRDGQGSAEGILYDPQTENVTLENNVRLKLAAQGKTSGGAVNLTASSMEFERKENLLRISGPVRAEQDGRVLVAGAMELQLDAAMRPAEARASGYPTITANDVGGAAKFSAGQMEGGFSHTGVLEKIMATDGTHGEWTGDTKNDTAKGDFSAKTVELLMGEERGENEPQKILANGNVKVAMSADKIRRALATESMVMDFARNKAGRGSHIARAESLAPAEITSASAKESARIHGGKIEAEFGAENDLRALNGNSGVEITRRIAGKPPETSSAQEFSAGFARSGEWENIAERGEVKFSENGRTGRADAAHFSRATNEATLTGAASVEDADSRLQAETIRIDEISGEVHASGKVVASYFGKRAGAGAAIASGTSISADEMNGTATTNAAPSNRHAVFSGNARMWQGTNVLQADTIELWQGEQHAEARGNVSGEFVEAAHQSGAQKQKRAASAPVLWHVQAAKVDYSSEAGKMEWSGGVKAHSSEGNISSDTLELTFAKSADGRQTLERAIANGGVRIEQNGRVGTAERGEYIAKEGKFVLSGGEPAIADASGNRTTGRELTFYLTNDSIVVDSGTKADTNPPANHY